MDDIKFRDLSDLYSRLLPALRSKRYEFNKKGLEYIKEIDIWNYLKDYKWAQARDLDLGVMVNDIMDIKEDVINRYIKDEYNRIRGENI